MNQGVKGAANILTRQDEGTTSIRSIVSIALLYGCSYTISFIKNHYLRSSRIGNVPKILTRPFFGLIVGEVAKCAVILKSEVLKIWSLKWLQTSNLTNIFFAGDIYFGHALFCRKFDFELPNSIAIGWLNIDNFLSPLFRLSRAQSAYFILITLLFELFKLLAKVYNSGS